MYMLRAKRGFAQSRDCPAQTLDPWFVVQTMDRPRNPGIVRWPGTSRAEHCVQRNRTKLRSAQCNCTKLRSAIVRNCVVRTVRNVILDLKIFSSNFTILLIFVA